MVRFETIRPAEFNQDFYRLPLIAEMGKIGKYVIQQYNLTTKTWEKSSRPKFKMKLSTIEKNRTQISVTVYTDNEIYPYVDFGVEGHEISAWPKIMVGEKVYGVAGTYIPGTIPGTLQTMASQGHKVLDGNYLNLNQTFWWPGIKARRWSEIITENLASEGDFDITRKLQRALDSSAKNAYKS